MKAMTNDGFHFNQFDEVSCGGQHSGKPAGDWRRSCRKPFRPQQTVRAPRNDPQDTFKVKTSQETAAPPWEDGQLPIISFTGNLTIPFRKELEEGLAVGRSITIKGVTNHTAQSLYVNLRVPDSSDIALHLNACLKKKVFVRNSFISGCWGPEETKLDSFPFTEGGYFEMIVLCESQQFCVAVNGQHQLDYKHRVQDLRRITQLEVLGDATLHAVILL
ncbi:galectin-8-like [Perca fluviatilis]|uniref:galectin-8-like n=1 Tax=Perca fluviatilis TaxID=8168 RepID=UPI0019626307|nr:galectin-8-like [Perca fluviatilis]